MQFRIVRVDKIKGSGAIDSTFTIQRKVLFWWVNHSVKICYLNSIWASIDRATPQFGTKEEAVEFLEKVKNPFYEEYKGNRIVRMPEIGKFKDMYLNLSYSRHEYQETEYEYSHSLSKLKEMIDKRVVKVNKVVV